MSPEDSTRILLKKARAAGLINPATMEGAPTSEMIVEAMRDCMNYEAEYEEVCVFARRLIRALRKHEPESQLAKDALEYLRCVGMAGSLYREKSAPPTSASDSGGKVEKS